MVVTTVAMVAALSAVGWAWTRSIASSAATSNKSPACASATGGAGVDRIDLAVAGTPRTSLVHLPSGWDGTTPLPVVVSFHGAGFDGSVMQLQDGVNTKADQEQFVVLHPDGLPVDLSGGAQPKIPGWDLSKNSKDPAFVKALLDELGRRVCIDPSRVFATGISNGAEMAAFSACALPKRIAGYAAVANGRPVPCGSETATPALVFHGLNDIVVPYDGAPKRGLLAAEKLMSDQAKQNGCNGKAPSIRHVSVTVESLTWVGCKAPTVLFRLDNHGHAWPGIPLPFPRPLVVASFASGGSANSTTLATGLTPDELADNVLLTNTEVNATDVMWEFFTSAHRGSGR
jgi:polyhydroxybutyrate depolymerase